MRTAYIDGTGPIEAIKVGELPDPRPGMGEVLVRVKAAALNPFDLYLRSGFVPMPMSFPYVLACDLAGTVDKLGPGAESVQGRRSRLGIEPRLARSARGRGGTGGDSRGLALSHSLVHHRQRRRRDGPCRDHRAPRSLPKRPTFRRRIGLRSRRRRRSRVDGRPNGQGRRCSRRDFGRKTRQHRFMQISRRGLALNYRTDDIPAALREWSPEGIDVWYETQREPNFEVAIPLLRRRGRMIVMAGRAAKPTFPLGSFYPRLFLVRFRRVQRISHRTALLRRRYDSMDRRRQTQARRRQSVPPRPRRRSATFP